MILKEINIIVRELEVICQGLDCKLLANDNLFNLAPRAASGRAPGVSRQKTKTSAAAVTTIQCCHIAHVALEYSEGVAQGTRQVRE